MAELKKGQMWTSAAHKNIEFKSILVFDDIIDSGTTLNECSRVLKEAGAGRVIVMTLATA